jgi:DNA-binding NtrC family response regulator
VLLGWPSVEPLLMHAQGLASASGEMDLTAPMTEGRRRVVEQFERRYLTEMLRIHQGKAGEVARAAGIDERYLYQKRKQYGLELDDFK